MKNDYRRALILLRSSLGGVNGHVRLERRTLMGSMQFTVSGLKTDMPLQAAMAAKTAAGWKITHIGTLGRDMRGQAGLNWTFDPRNIEGLPLEKYIVLLVLETDGHTCRAVLTGYVNGAKQVDWDRVEQAACASYIHAAQNSTENIMHKSVPETPPQTAPENIPQEGVPETLPQTADEGFDAPAVENTAMQNAESSGQDEFDRPSAQESAAEETNWAEKVFADPMDAPAKEGTAAASTISIDTMDAPAKEETAAASAIFADPMDIPAREAKTAMEALGLDAARRWPENIEPLREAFAASVPVFMQEMPDHVFVRMAHSAECPLCMTGVRAKDGAPLSVAYAIPTGGQEETPAGLEGYMRRGDWWIAVADAETGAYMHI